MSSGGPRTPGVGLSKADAAGAYASKVPAWQATHDYLQGELVTSGGILYSANSTFTSGASFNATNWTAIGGGAGVVDATQTVSGRWSFSTMPEIHSLSGDATPINGRSVGDGKTVGTWNLVHDGTVGDLFHLTTGPNTGPSRTVADGVTTNGSTTVTSATAAFTTGAVLAGVGTDLGKTISGTGIPAGATITAVNSATSVTISAPATSSGSGRTLTLGSGPNVNGAVIAIGVDNGGTGIITRNKSTGVALKVDHLNSVSSSSSYGILLANDAPVTAGEAVRIYHTGAATSMNFVAGGAAAPASSLFLTMNDNGVGGSILAGRVFADTGLFDWRRSIQTVAPNSSGTPIVRVADEATNPTETFLTAKTTGGTYGGVAGLVTYKWSGSAALMWASRIVQDATNQNYLKFQMGSSAVAKGSESYKTLITLGGTQGTTGGISFYNGTPVAQPTRVGQLTDSSGGTSGGATVAAVTDVATAANAIATLVAKVNSMEAKLSAAGGGIGVWA